MGVFQTLLAGNMVQPLRPWPPKLAVTVAGAFRVVFCGVVVPVRAPEKPVNWYPEFAVALTATTAPALNQPLAGAIEPPAARFAAVVRKYCVVNVAVYVVDDDGAVTVCEAAPLSDQLPNRYCIPLAPACEAAAIVWLE